MTGLERNRARHTQCWRIAELLRQHAGQWVSLQQILQLGIAMYAARIWQLRHELGLNIENRTETVNGTKHSWYRLAETSPTSTVLAPPPRAEQIPAQSPLPPPEYVDLFPDLAPSPQWRDPEEEGLC